MIQNQNTLAAQRRYKVAEQLILIFVALLVLGGNLRIVRAHSPENTVRKRHPHYSTEPRPYEEQHYVDHGLNDELSDAGKEARGFYLTPHFLRKIGPTAIARTMNAAHVNAVVIDMKDDWGNVLWPSTVALSRGLQNHLIHDPRAIIESFHRAGIYVIARLVCLKDSRLPRKRADLSVRFRFQPKRLFHAGAGWIDIYAREVQDYLIDLAREWEQFGVDEIQLDYIRFPKGHTGTLGLWLHQNRDPRPRATVIANFLERMDRALTTPLSADVYGLTTFVDGDPRKLGQTIESMAPYIEAISPMMYANGMTSYFRNHEINRGIYTLLQCGIWRARRKAPNIILRPYLQAYPQNVPFFGETFIRKQVEAAHAAGAEGFLFWNASMKNKIAYRALRKMPPKRSFSPATIDPHQSGKRPNRCSPTAIN